MSINTLIMKVRVLVYSEQIKSYCLHGKAVVLTAKMGLFHSIILLYCKRNGVGVLNKELY